MHSTFTPVITRVSRWDGVETDRTRDAVRFHVDGQAFAHLSAGGMLTVPTTPPLRNQLLTDGFADTVPQAHDRVSYRLRSSADVPGAIRLLRVAYLSHHQTEPHRTSFETLRDHLRRLDASSELLVLLAGSGTETDHKRRLV